MENAKVNVQVDLVLNVSIDKDEVLETMQSIINSKDYSEEDNFYNMIDDIIKALYLPRNTEVLNIIDGDKLWDIYDYVSENLKIDEDLLETLKNN